MAESTHSPEVIRALASLKRPTSDQVLVTAEGDEVRFSTGAFEPGWATRLAEQNRERGLLWV